MVVESVPETGIRSDINVFATQSKAPLDASTMPDLMMKTLGCAPQHLSPRS